MDIKAAVLLELKDQISLHNQEFEGNSQNVRAYGIYIDRHMR